MNEFNQPDVGPYRQRFSQISTMMRLPHVEDADGLDIAFVGVPFDMGIFFRPGARSGPSQIREMSRMLRAVHTANNVAPFDLCQVADLGDAPVNPMNYDGTIERITDFFADLANRGVTPLAMGGDHTIPVPILRGLKKGGAIDAPVGMIHVDAHADVLQTGPAFDGNAVNHGTFVRLAIEEGLVDPKRTVQIGLRGTQYTADANDFAVEAGCRMIYQHEFDALGVNAVIEEVRRVIGDGPVYFTIDVDGLDPTCCPGTGHPEPGGIDMREMNAIMRGCRGIDMIGGDVSEVSPPLDVSGMTALNAAHLLFDMLCLTAEAITARRARA
jgi:guanidinopropionase